MALDGITLGLIKKELTEYLLLTLNRLSNSVVRLNIFCVLTINKRFRKT